MCGIVGYIGKKRAAPVLIDGLYKLEYRGYDSAGIALQEAHGGTYILRRKGRVSGLECAREHVGNVGIGHTRWATHGAPSEENAHPHSYRGITLVHNGIVENAFTLKEECLKRGETFSSETDSEVVAHLIAHAYQGDLLQAVREATSRLTGSYALVILCDSEPGRIVCARKYSPLIVGKRGEELFVASDVPALAGEGMELFGLDDGEFASLEGGEITFYNALGEEIFKEAAQIDCDEEVPVLRGHSHYMRKEMGEIPAVLARLHSYSAQNNCFLGLNEVLCQTYHIHVVACGTAYHAGLCAKYAIERLCRVPVEVFVASEYRYSNPIVQTNTLAIAISQSGETADTLAAAQLAREKGAYLLAVTNIAHSSLTRISDGVLFTHAGREIGVAATKSFNAQLVTLYALCGALAKAKGLSIPPMDDFARLAEVTLEQAKALTAWAEELKTAKNILFIGRGIDYCIALEGSLKLKEISYLPAEGYPAGELKHGTLALIEENSPVIAVLTQKSLAEKTMNAVHEAYTRGARVYLVTNLPEYAERSEVGASIVFPACEEVFSPVLSVIPLQMLAYFTSLSRGHDPDKPRNLAKSVTVE